MKIKLIISIALISLVSINNISSQSKIDILKTILIKDNIKHPELFRNYGDAILFENPTINKTKNNRVTEIDTLDLYWQVLRKVIEQDPKSFDERFEIKQFIRAFLADFLDRYGDQEYDKLKTIYKSLPDTSYLREGSLLIPFYQYQVYKGIKNIFEKQVQPNTHLSYSIAKPNRNTSADKEEYFNNCKDLFNSVQKHYEQRVLKDTVCGWYSFQSNHLLFYKTLEDILFDSSTEDLKKLNKFRWGGWCGTGSEYFYTKQELVELLILLRERDYLSILGRKDYYFGTNIGEKIKIKLLNLCNIDWIDYYTGAILSGKLNSIPSFFTKSGSDKAAQILFELKDSISNKGWYIVKCAEFINPTSEQESEYSVFFDENQFLKKYELGLPFPSFAVNNDLKKKLKQEILSISQTADELYLCHSSIDALQKINFDEDVNWALLVLTKSRFSIIRKNAANVLKEKGITVDLPKDDGKIKFKFMIDGMPLKKDMIRWELYNASTPSKSFLNSTNRTNDEGILFITRDLLLDRIAEIQKIVFYPDSWNGGGKQAIFYCESYLPKDLNDTTIINISTVSVSIRFHLNRNSDFYKKKKMQIHAFPSEVSTIDYEPEVQEEFSFPNRFQKNIKCSFFAYVPGAVPWSSPIQDTLKDDIVMDAYLENGTVVTFNIVPPGGKEADKGVVFDLERIGKSKWEDLFYYDYSLGGYKYLPIGEYNLIISSSAEKKSKYQKNDNNCGEQIVAEYSDYKGKIISFTVSEGSPPEINLGTIILDPIDQ